MTLHAMFLTLLCLQTACATPGVDVAGCPSSSAAAVPLRCRPDARVPRTAGPPNGQRDRALMDALRAGSPQVSDFGDGRVSYVFEDLNGDGVHEAIVYLSGADFCGTGGCTTLVYQWDSSASGYAEVDKSPTTRPPIYVSARAGCEWSMLWAQRSGGGRSTELHSPIPLPDVGACEAPVGPWNEAESQLLIPVNASHDEVTAP